jgi:polyhydroxyalkanoate synthesis regulator phasin
MEENKTDVGMDYTTGQGGATPGGPLEQSEGVVKRAVLASVGAVATACDTASQTYDQLVDRGQQVTDQWQERAGEMRRQNAGMRGRFGDYFRGAVDTLLHNVNIPSKTDLDTVNVKLNIMSRKLDELQTGRGRDASAGPSAYTPPPPPPVDEDLAT